jgi:hypothetical protein
MDYEKWPHWLDEAMWIDSRERVNVTTETKTIIKNCLLDFFLSSSKVNRGENYRLFVL